MPYRGWDLPLLLDCTSRRSAVATRWQLKPRGGGGRCQRRRAAGKHVSASGRANGRQSRRHSRACRGCGSEQCCIDRGRKPCATRKALPKHCRKGVAPCRAQRLRGTAGYSFCAGAACRDASQHRGARLQRHSIGRVARRAGAAPARLRARQTDRESIWTVQAAPAQ